MRDNLFAQLMEEKLMEFLTAKSTIKDTIVTPTKPSVENSSEASSPEQSTSKEAGQ